MLFVVIIVFMVVLMDGVITEWMVAGMVMVMAVMIEVVIVEVAVAVMFVVMVVLDCKDSLTISQRTKR